MADRDPRVIGTRIARRRHQLGWTQIELAEQLGVSPSTVANWERGASYPKKKFGKVEQVLGIVLGEEPEQAEKLSPEEAAELREHIREVLGEGSAVEAALDADLYGKDPPPTGRPRAGAAAASSSRRRPLPRTG